MSGQPPVDDLLLEVCDYSTLSSALEELEGQGIEICPDPLSAEEWTINLQNHLIWGTITKTGNKGHTLVAGLALCQVAKRHGVPPYCLPGRAGELAACLLPERGD